jgi:hypothetical protein
MANFVLFSWLLDYSKKFELVLSWKIFLILNLLFAKTQSMNSNFTKNHIEKFPLSYYKSVATISRSSDVDFARPEITSTYSVLGPSESNKFSSTSFINYSPMKSSNSNFNNFYPPATSYGYPVTNYESYSSKNYPNSVSTPISQHIEVTKPYLMNI